MSKAVVLFGPLAHIPPNLGETMVHALAALVEQFIYPQVVPQEDRVYSIKIDIPEFNGEYEHEVFVEWINLVKHISISYFEVLDDRQVPLVAQISVVMPIFGWLILCNNVFLNISNQSVHEIYEGCNFC